jgi:hypothetical protein
MADLRCWGTTWRTDQAAAWFCRGPSGRLNRLERRVREPPPKGACACGPASAPGLSP